MATVKRYLESYKSYNGYTITKVNSGSDLQSIYVLTNVRKAVLLTNNTLGEKYYFSRMKAASQYLEISSQRLSNYF